MVPEDLRWEGGKHMNLKSKKIHFPALISSNKHVLSGLSTSLPACQSIQVNFNSMSFIGTAFDVLPKHCWNDYKIRW